MTCSFDTSSSVAEVHSEEKIKLEMERLLKCTAKCNQSRDLLLLFERKNRNCVAIGAPTTLKKRPIFLSRPRYKRSTRRKVAKKWISPRRNSHEYTSSSSTSSSTPSMQEHECGRRLAPPRMPPAPRGHGITTTKTSSTASTKCSMQKYGLIQMPSRKIGTNADKSYKVSATASRRYQEQEPARHIPAPSVPQIDLSDVDEECVIDSDLFSNTEQEDFSLFFDRGMSSTEPSIVTTTTGTTASSLYEEQNHIFPNRFYKPMEETKALVSHRRPQLKRNWDGYCP